MDVIVLQWFYCDSHDRYDVEEGWEVERDREALGLICIRLSGPSLIYGPGLAHALHLAVLGIIDSDVFEFICIL